MSEIKSAMTAVASYANSFLTLIGAKFLKSIYPKTKVRGIAKSRTTFTIAAAFMLSVEIASRLTRLIAAITISKNQ